jgi:hypothetical protein
MKAYILSDADFAKLLSEIDRNPKYGANGGSNINLSHEQLVAFDEAHHIFNFIIRKWIDEVKK